MVELCIKLLGSFEATLGGIPVSGFESDKARALLAYLAVESDRVHSRERLAGLLWPDASQSAAMGSLRRVLSNLRDVLEDREVQPPRLLVTRQTLALNGEATVRVDVTRFLALAQVLGSSEDVTALEEIS